MWRLICLAWLAASLVAIGIQISSWWQYHFLLLIAPLGILATFGFEFLVRNVTAGRKRMFGALALAGVVAYVAVPLPQGAIGTLLQVAAERPYRSTRALERYRIATNGEYAAAYQDATVASRLRSDNRIYVFGDPLIYLDSQTTQTIAMSSWGIQLFTPGLWRRTITELCRARPDDLFVFDRFIGYLRRGDHGAMTSILALDYVSTKRTGDGQWYRRRSSGTFSSCSSRRIGGGLGLDLSP